MAGLSGIARLFKGFARGQIRYFIRDDADRHGPRGNYGDPSSGSSTADEITKWVAVNFVAHKVGEATVYDLAR